MTDEKPKMGRPVKFNTLEDLEEGIKAYFESCHTVLINKQGEIVKTADGKEVKYQSKPYTIMGLCNALDCDRKTLLNYQKDESKPDFFHAIMRAKAKCHEYAEEMLFDKGASRGAQFSLKNNYDWEDRVKQDSTHKIKGRAFRFVDKDPKAPEQ